MSLLNYTNTIEQSTKHVKLTINKSTTHRSININGIRVTHSNLVLKGRADSNKTTNKSLLHR